MSIQRNEFARFIKLLNDAGCLEHVILIGSWAEYLYKELQVIDGFTPNIKTLDVDFLIKNLRRPPEQISLIPLAREAGYFVEPDRLTGTTRIMDRYGLEIEFLIGKAGAGLEMALKTNLGVTAQSLWHTRILSSNTLVVDFLGMDISIPKPEAYAIHKAVINKKRKNKKEKDAQAIISMWPFLNRSELTRIMTTLTKKELADLNAFLDEHHLLLDRATHEDNLG